MSQPRELRPFERVDAAVGVSDGDFAIHFEPVEPEVTTAPKASAVRASVDSSSSTEPNTLATPAAAAEEMSRAVQIDEPTLDLDLS